MSGLPFLMAVLLAIGLFLVAKHFPRTKNQRIIAYSAFLLYSLCALYFFYGPQKERISKDTHVIARRPVQSNFDGYVGSETCRECHTRQHTTWQASWHRTMTQVASSDTVLGSFDDRRLVLDGSPYHLKTQGRDVFVEMGETTHPGAKRIERQIVLTTGSHNHQVYWYAQGKGRNVGLMPFKWLIRENRWVPFRASFLMPPATAHHRLEGDWNKGCIKCHVTLGQPRLRQDGHADTRVAEFGISCEACHGPGETHVNDHQNKLADENIGASELVNPALLAHDRSSEVCGQCHSVSGFYSSQDMKQWNTHGYSFRPGEELSQSRVIIRKNAEVMETELMKRILASVPNFLEKSFWSDGMIRLAGREYNGLLESPCFQQGKMSCLSCHQMHQSEEDPREAKEWADDQLQIGMQSNQACTQCHEKYSSNIEAHTHHPATSSGSQCYNCHMPYTTWGLLKAVRSHEVDSPSVQATLETGRPNACNQCHLDKSLAWASQKLNHWYGLSLPELSEDEKTIAASLLWLYEGDAGQRALAAWSMGWTPAREVSRQRWMAPHLAQLLDDPYDAVRFVAQRSLRRLPGFESLQYDFLSPAEGSTFAPIVASVRGQWQKQRDRTKNERAILIDKTGRLNIGKITQLLKKRDDKVVQLTE